VHLSSTFGLSRGNTGGLAPISTYHQRPAHLQMAGDASEAALEQALSMPDISGRHESAVFVPTDLPPV